MDKIFKYPAVQYIPLQLYDSKKGSNPFNLVNPRIVIDDNHEVHSLYNIFLLRIILDIVEEGYLKIKVYNGEIDFIKYRGHEIFMVGKKSPGRYHFFQVTKKYFYKQKLIFTFYNKNNGEKLARQRYNLR